MNIFDKALVVDKDAFVAPSASVIGDVQVRRGSSIWYGSVLRDKLSNKEVHSVFWEQERPEVSHLGWGRRYTLRELEAATSGLYEENVIGEDGYGIGYRGVLIDGTKVVVNIERLGEKTKRFVKCLSDLHSTDPLFIYTLRNKCNLHLQGY